MKLSRNTLIILLIAVFESSWLEEASVSAAPILGDMDFSSLNNNFPDHLDSLLGSDDSEKSMKEPIYSYGAQTYQINKVFPENNEKYVVYGSRDDLHGNYYYDDREKSGNIQYGSSVVRDGNYYYYNPGKNNQSLSKLSANGKMNSEELDKFSSFLALNSYRESISDTVPNQCSRVNLSFAIISFIILMYGFTQ